MSLAIFDYILYESVTWWSVGFLSVSCMNYFLGCHYIYKELFSYDSDEAERNRITYDQNRAYFFAEYDRCNPVTQASATINFLKYLRKRNPKMAS